MLSAALTYVTALETRAWGFSKKEARVYAVKLLHFRFHVLLAVLF